MRSALTALLLVLAQAASATPSLLHNGSFERGDFSGWVLTGNTEYSQVYDQAYDGLSAHGGADYALLGPQGTVGILSQSFSDTPGEALTVSFWLASDGGATDFLAASFDGGVLMQLGDAGAFGWRRYTETVIGTGQDTLSFSVLDDQDYFALDSVHVTEVLSRPGIIHSGGAVPEPATRILLIVPAALLGMILLRRRMRGPAL